MLSDTGASVVRPVALGVGSFTCLVADYRGGNQIPAYDGIFNENGLSHPGIGLAEVGPGPFFPAVDMTLNTTLDCVAGIGVAVLVVVGIAAAPAAEQDNGSEPRVIEVLAKRFEFEPARIDVTEGETVRLVVRSADGMHGVGIKKFKVAEEVPRGGEAVTIEFTANAVGEFDIMCSEFCGKGHGGMKGKLVVRAREGGRR